MVPKALPSKRRRRHDADAGGDREVLATKAALREQLWADLDRPGVARFIRVRHVLMIPERLPPDAVHAPGPTDYFCGEHGRMSHTRKIGPRPDEELSPGDQVV